MIYRVLIVDDAGFIREIIASICKQYGCEMIIEAATGDEAVRIASKMKPHLIFLDVVMPEKNGLEAAKLILQTHPLTKVVAMSTLNDKDIQSSLIQVGCKEFLEKPFTKLEIQRILEKYRPHNKEVTNV